MNASFLGNPPASVKAWILSHSSFSWDALIAALEKGNIKNGILDGITVDGNPLAVGSILTSKIFYYQGDDGEIVDDCEWIVCGFNGAVPAYVKYMDAAGKKLFLKASDENDAERSIQNGDPVFTRSWNPSSLAYDYARVGSVSSQEGSFEYGATSDDFGTVSIKDPYAVPRKIAVAMDDRGSAEEASFAGSNMQLWSKHMLLDADAAGSLEKAQEMMNDSKQCTTMSFGSSHFWHESFIRSYLNGTSLPAGSIWNDATKAGYATKHSFLEKASASPAFLQAVCMQVNRNYVVDYKANYNHGTIDLFWLPGCDHLKTAYETSWPSFNDESRGLCEEPEFSKHLEPAFRNGCIGVEDFEHGCLLRSACSDTHGLEFSADYVVAALNDGIDLYTGYSNAESGFAPACSIG